MKIYVRLTEFNASCGYINVLLCLNRLLHASNCQFWICWTNPYSVSRLAYGSEGKRPDWYSTNRFRENTVLSITWIGSCWRTTPTRFVSYRLVMYTTTMILVCMQWTLFFELSSHILLLWWHRARWWADSLNTCPNKGTCCSNTARIYKIWIVFKN
jgi:hypothetical protein